MFECVAESERTVTQCPRCLPERQACRDCGEDKPATEFYLNSKKTRLLSYCKTCNTIRARKQRAEKAAPPTKDAKACIKCGQTKPAKHFHRRACRADGLNPWCKVCRKVHRGGAPKASVPPSLLAALTPKRCSACGKTKPVNLFCRSRANKDGRSIYCRQCSVQRTARWKSSNPGKVADSMRIQNGKRRVALKGGSLGKVSAALVRTIGDAQRWRCAYCPSSIRKRYHLDHITPLARGGAHEARNLQLTCPPCNSSKAATDPILFAQSMGKLL